MCIWMDGRMDGRMDGWVIEALYFLNYPSVSLMNWCLKICFKKAEEPEYSDWLMKINSKVIDWKLWLIDWRNGRTIEPVGQNKIYINWMSG